MLLSKYVPPYSNSNRKINAYILQLNIYRIMLESEYDMKIHGMYIACFHPSLPSYRIVDIPRLSHMFEIELVDLRLSEL